MVHAIASVCFGAVFVVAGATKVSAPSAWRSQAAGLRVPAPVAVAVPAVELVVGAAIAVQLLSPWSAVAGLCLLVAFTAVIAANLRAGRHPPCACFGAWSATPISWQHVARNVAFVALGIATVATT